MILLTTKWPTPALLEPGCQARPAHHIHRRGLRVQFGLGDGGGFLILQNDPRGGMYMKIFYSR